MSFSEFLLEMCAADFQPASRRIFGLFPASRRWKKLSSVAAAAGWFFHQPIKKYNYEYQLNFLKLKLKLLNPKTCLWKWMNLNLSWTLAFQVYCIPATSTPRERILSVAGVIVNSKRSQLHPDNVDNNYDYVKERIFKVTFE